ncbi:AAA family ATPase [Agaribacterium haliotis]|uniref:AAA family ATPase n=1 Tax=Agaribacterium haliotis TaxID=2013869 RepID=UPI000BB54D9B|nr:AAA family ATPase [Agaribacterium haliotis]
MNNSDLGILLRGRAPLIVLESFDERRALELLSAHARQMNVAASYWTRTDGIAPLGFGLELSEAENYAEPEAALRHMKAVSGPHLFVLCDMHAFLDDALIIRLLKDIAQLGLGNEQKVLLLSHRLTVPPELTRLSAKAKLKLPDENEIAALVRLEARRWQEENGGQRVKTDAQSLELLVQNLKGLPHEDVKRLAWGAIADDGAISESDVPALNKAKFALMDMDSVLHFEYQTAGLADVAGFRNMKAWLEKRKPAMFDDAPDTLKGLLLFGVQGGGKSLAAKAVAGMWQLPLLRLDMAALYNKYIGETERNLREALKLADNMQPCVLWIDELEKGLAEDADNSVGKRLLGTLLTWMAERRSKVFLVATSNDISQLPPELMRKGRFDEVFFVDLPDAEVRAEIFKLHLHKRAISSEHFDLSELASASAAFTGAEIEQALVSACYHAQAEAIELNQAHLCEALAQTRPLSVLQAEKMAALRSWAADRSVPA